ncbi:putative manganese-dependent inorganic diphosphatase [Alkalicella caledoniensis]|uniref:inorganic diphosphatase n=1 Tax=Alkalicella caledoniensis TaxID=2731377 RepID=A0A7G9W6U8_ALKCA|nr:putative manganese-dependent inorganic diphosphatase [Alkalicella caledoniensis]QNO14410.1 putative manganese-dependent inorganic diphosphatase [Alkalicella caledoniensis]
MKKEIIILGHKNPDTDSVASAISYSALKNKLGQSSVPKVCSAITGEAKHVLELLDIEAPKLLETMELRAIDIMNTEHPSLWEGESLKNIGFAMEQNRVKTIPLVDTEGVIKGIITAGDFAKLYLQEIYSGEIISAPIRLEKIRTTLNGIIYSGDSDERISGRILVGAMSVEKLLENLEVTDILIVGDRENCHLAALEHGINGLIITGGVKPTEKVLEMAKVKNTPVIGFNGDTFTAARLISLSRSGKNIMTKNPLTLDINSTVTEIKDMFAQKGFRSFPVVDDEGKLLGIVTKGEILNSKPKKIILVDHNERSQSVEGLEWGEVIEIIDHHRLGDIQTTKPIYINCKPVGSTATLVAEMYQQHNITPNKKIASLMLAAILSDTVILKSPTTTDQDRDAAKYLSTVSELSIKEFGKSIYSWSNNLDNITPFEMLTLDLKEFSFLKGKMAIGQFETTDSETVLKLRSELIKEMERMIRKRNLDHVLLAITNIVEGDSYLLSVGNLKSYINQAFGAPENEIHKLNGVMSRKLQIVPPLSGVLNS